MAISCQHAEHNKPFKESSRVTRKATFLCILEHTVKPRLSELLEYSNTFQTLLDYFYPIIKYLRLSELPIIPSRQSSDTRGTTVLYFNNGVFTRLDGIC